MSYDSVMEQVKSVPAEYLEEVSNYIAYILYRYKRQNSKIEEFNELCVESQEWTKSVGLTESDIQSVKKEIRAEKKH